MDPRRDIIAAIDAVTGGNKTRFAEDVLGIPGSSLRRHLSDGSSSTTPSETTIRLCRAARWAAENLSEKQQKLFFDFLKKGVDE